MQFTLTSTVTGTLPYTVGFSFRQGDIPGTQGILASVGTSQAVVKNFWPDNSVKFAVVSGRVPATAGTPVTVQLAAGTPPAGSPALTTAQLRDTGIVAAIDCGGLGAASWSGADWLSPAQNWVSGPEMSSWVYRKQIGSDNHLVGWLEVRFYSNGAVEVLPWVENAYLLVAAPSNKNSTYTFSLGGSTRFSQTLDIKHHTRVALVSGTAYSHWLGTDPGVTVRHDTAYLMATRLVPNYAVGVNESAYSFTESYTPNSIGDSAANMGNAGYSAHIGVLPQWAAVYLAGGADARAYRYVLANGLAAGAWSIHYRNHASNAVPTFAEFPNLSTEWGGSPTVPSGTGGTNAKGGVPSVADNDHQPSLAYLPYLLTGRVFFLEETLFWDFFNFSRTNYQTREGAKGIEITGTGRGRGWNLRTRAQAFAIAPSTHTSFASLKASWEANTAAYKEIWITGTRSGGVLANALGCTSLYGGGGTSPYGTEGAYWWDAPWMQATIAMAFGHGWDLGLPQSAASIANHAATRDFAYKQFIDRAGDGSPGTWNYRRFSVFAVPYCSPSTFSPPTSWIPSWGAAYAIYEAHGRISTDFGPLAPLPAGTGMFYGDAPVTGDDWASSTATCFNMAALAFAADQSVPGAMDGWRRITGSSSYATAAAAFRGNPNWAIQPR